jgi:hypothetical protein
MQLPGTCAAHVPHVCTIALKMDTRGSDGPLMKEEMADP